MSKFKFFAKTGPLLSIVGFLILIGLMVSGHGGVIHIALGAIIAAGAILVLLGVILSLKQQR